MTGVQTCALPICSLLLQVLIDNLGWMGVEALGHTVDPYSGAQMGLGITGTYNFNYLTLFSFN